MYRIAPPLHSFYAAFMVHASRCFCVLVCIAHEDKSSCVASGRDKRIAWLGQLGRSTEGAPMDESRQPKSSKVWHCCSCYWLYVLVALALVLSLFVNYMFEPSHAYSPELIIPWTKHELCSSSVSDVLLSASCMFPCCSHVHMMYSGKRRQLLLAARIQN